MKFRIRIGKASILRRLLVVLCAVVLFQMCANLWVFQVGGVVKRAEKNAFSIFAEQTDSRNVYLQNEMVRRWASTSETEFEVKQQIQELLEEQEMNVHALLQDATLCARIAGESVENLIGMLRRNGVTGAFLVLDSPNEEGNYPGVYIRDSDPAGYDSQNSDLLLERGLPSVARTYKMAMDRYWTAHFRFGNHQAATNQFYFKPLEAAKKAAVEDRKSEYDCYWSQAFSLSELDQDIITYSIPLIWEDGTVLGVLGVEITVEYLSSMLKYTDLNDEGAGAYFLGVSRDGGSTYEQVCSKGPSYDLYFNDAVLRTEKGPYNDIVILQTDETQRYQSSHTVYGVVKPLYLYNKNTPFEKERWALIGVMDEEHLLHFSRSLWAMLVLSTALSLMLGVGIVVFAARSLSEPISRLVTDLRDSDPDRPIRLNRIHITEIDALSEAVETMSNRAAESAARISKIISLTGVPIGVFEYRGREEKVFCSRNLFRLLQWPETGEEDEYLDALEFQCRMQKLMEYREEEEHLLLLKDEQGRNLWLKSSYSEEGGTMLGVFQDVTHETEAKRQVEYERDYDVLTGLFNRRAFDSRLSALLLSGTQNELGTAALLMFDLDNLKYVNDTFGHDWGDCYIRAFAKMLGQFPRAGCVTGRRSGDEFNVFLYGYQNKKALRDAVAQFQNCVGQEKLELPGGEHASIRASGGLAWYPEDATEYHELLRRADFAMYHIKHTVKGTIQEFDPLEYAERISMLSEIELLSGERHPI